jgi:hypothetical protein
MLEKRKMEIEERVWRIGEQHIILVNKNNNKIVYCLFIINVECGTNIGNRHTYATER